ncbi:hypothetical protein [Shimia sp.]|uniref:hypothetical protein n=1 Tax=Shimia sp. TaxID=1954381 RepID=UPI003299FF34
MTYLISTELWALLAQQLNKILVGGAIVLTGVGQRTILWRLEDATGIKDFQGIVLVLLRIRHVPARPLRMRSLNFGGAT